MTHIVVVGAGQAGASLCAKLRNAGFTGQITLIGNEPVPPYQRPPLSKTYLLGEMPLDRLLLRPEQFYTEQDITLRLGQPAEQIDTAAKTLVLGREVLHYDELVLATGLTPRRLPASIGGALAGVHVVRTLAHVDALAAPFLKGGSLLVVGGGYIGLEAAAVAAQKGLKVTLVELADRLLSRVACPETAAYFHELHQHHGVDIRLGTSLERLDGDGHVTGALLSDATRLDVDIVIAGIGVIPGCATAEAAGIEMENGIKTDAFGRTTTPHVWAAGDCASFPHEGGRIRLESVGNAIDQAEIVAENLLGAEKPYMAKPWFWSDQYDVKLQIAGLNTGYDRVVTRADGAARSHWYYRGAALLSVDAMNDARAYMIGKRLIEAGKHPSPEVVADPATDMKALLR
jgi:3-phenylpropionate/trans-cinnamate dioxygenase ferredoxin reductase subunit